MIPYCLRQVSLSTVGGWENRTTIGYDGHGFIIPFFVKRDYLISVDIWKVKEEIGFGLLVLSLERHLVLSFYD